MQKMLITGAGGGLGAVLKEYFADKYIVAALTSAEMDVTNMGAVDTIMGNVRPDIVVHCAAIVNADQAEGNKAKTYKVNVIGTENVVRCCKNYNALLVFISSDYVFSGNNEIEYSEEDLVDPINYYGVTKILGEQIAKDLLSKYYILRVSWLFGPFGTNFLQKILTKSQEKEINVVDDQIGSPTYTVHVATIIEQLLKKKVWGTYHVTNENYCTWAEYAEKILQLCNSQTTVNKVDSNTYKTLAPRPKNSKLSKDKLYSVGIKSLPTWEDALEEFFETYIGKRE